jgi:hypothetical protein
VLPRCVLCSGDAAVLSHMTPVAARMSARRRAARGLPAPALLPLLLCALLLSTLPAARAQDANCSALACPYECDAVSGCYDECDRKGWTLAAQRDTDGDTDVYDLPCTRRDVRCDACVRVVCCARACVRPWR